MVYLIVWFIDLTIWPRNVLVDSNVGSTVPPPPRFSDLPTALLSNCFTCLLSLETTAFSFYEIHLTRPQVFKLAETQGLKKVNLFSQENNLFLLLHWCCYSSKQYRGCFLLFYTFFKSIHFWMADPPTNLKAGFESWIDFWEEQYKQKKETAYSVAIYDIIFDLKIWSSVVFDNYHAFISRIFILHNFARQIQMFNLMFYLACWFKRQKLFLSNNTYHTKVSWVLLTTFVSVILRAKFKCWLCFN